ncbi:hydantoinase B/oxoprolinase family protein [Nocardia cerradoensis]|nr:hydantoinase B/oxoprolinase family protein [Nocardia cerradoensis]
MYASRDISAEQLRAAVSPKLPLHEIDASASERVDALTYEVVRHRIWSITDEMGQTLRRMSGSPGVTESNDFGFAICDELGNEVQVGLANTGIVASMDLAVYWILQHRSHNPGIEPGDMFLTNDPWTGGGLHQNDAAIIAPFFWEGELFGWTSSCCHLIDVGGSKAGSADIMALDVFSEGAPTPPVKVVRQGTIQNDVLESFTRRSRMPLLVNLDLRAEISANLTAQAGLRKLIERYGPTTVKAVMKRMMDDSEAQLRERLRAIPDGSWSSTGYIEQAVVGDRNLYNLELELTKKGDHLTFDFRGTASSVGMVNSPYSGMRAAVLVGLLPILAGDIPWSTGGLMRCFDLISDEDTISNAAFPAAVGWAPISAMWGSSNLVVECMGKMLDTSIELRSRSQSVCTGSYDIVTMAGVDENGNPFVAIDFDGMAGGYGATPEHDGGDTSGILPIPMGRAPDVEMQEFLNPYLVLWRREEPDSGGPGQFRGGVSLAEALSPHRTPAPMFGSFMGSGKARPDASGLAGGYPGGCQLDIVVRDAEVAKLFAEGRVPTSVEELGGTQEVVPTRYETQIGVRDVVFIHPGGGGGFGDPLLRDPAHVARDVASGRVTPGSAEQIYGVILGPDGTVDAEATATQRTSLRKARLGPQAGELRSVKSDATELDSDTYLDTNFTIVEGPDGRAVACRHCEITIGPAAADHLGALHVRTGEPAEGGSAVWSDPRLHIDSDTIFRQLCCPGCGTAVHTAVVPAHEPVLGRDGHSSCHGGAKVAP